MCIAEKLTFPKLTRPDRWGESGDCYLLNILHAFCTFCPKNKWAQRRKQLEQKMENKHIMVYSGIEAPESLGIITRPKSRRFGCQFLRLLSELVSKRIRAQKNEYLAKEEKHKRQHLCRERRVISCDHWLAGMQCEPRGLHIIIIIIFSKSHLIIIAIIIVLIIITKLPAGNASPASYHHHRQK